MSGLYKTAFLAFILCSSRLLAQVPVISWTVTPNDTVCDGSTIHVVEAASNGPFSTSSFTLGPAAGGQAVTGTISGAGTNIYVTLMGSGPYTYCASATNSSGTGYGCYTVIVLPTTSNVAISASPQNSLCAGQPVSFTATPTNGGSNPSYQWQVNGVNAGTNSPYFSPSTLSNGNVVSVIMHTSSPCATDPEYPATYTVHITQPQTPSVTIDPDPAFTCAGGYITFTASASSGGTNPSYQWSVNGVNSGNSSSTFTLTNPSAGDQVVVMLTSNASCITTNTATSNTVSVNIDPLPSLTVIATNSVICPQQPDTLIVQGPPGATFSWYPGTGLNNTVGDTVIATASNSGQTVYFVDGTLNGCVSKDSVIVQITNTLTATGIPKQTICEGQSAPLFVSGGDSWVWQPDGSLSCSACADPIASPTTSTGYSVTAMFWGCTSVVVDSVDVIPGAVADFSYSVSVPGIPQTVAFSNQSTNALSYNWNFGDLSSSGSVNPLHNYFDEGSYEVSLIAYGNYGCNDTTRIDLVVKDTIGIIIPNIFSPNGDDVNDVFSVDMRGFTTRTITIYDRWGIKMFESESKNYWDGSTTAGLPCVEGTYYYIFSGTDNMQRSHAIRGFLQLVR